MRTPLQLLLASLVLSASAASAASAETPAELCARTARSGHVEACQAALAIDRGDLASRRHLAHAYLARNDYENMARVHGEIVALAPDDHRTHYDFAAALAAFWRTEEAMEPLAIALRLKPDDAPTLRLAAILYDASRRFGDSFVVIKRAAEAGDRLQMFELAARYRDGQGTSADPAASFYWLSRAAASGHVTAMIRLRDLYTTGSTDFPADAAKAAYWDERQRREGVAPP